MDEVTWYNINRGMTYFVDITGVKKKLRFT